MTPSRAIVTTALRKLGRVGGGRDPRPADLTDGMDALVSLYQSWLNSGAFGRLHDVVPTGNYMAVGNERIYRPDGVSWEVTLPELVSSHSPTGHRYYGTVITITQTGEDVDVLVQPSQPLNGHCVNTPRDLAPIAISDHAGGNTITYLYDGGIKKWVPLWNIGLDDAAPLSARDANGLASCLAMNLSDQWGADVAPATQLAASHFKSALVTRFSTPSTVVAGSYY